MSDLLRPSKVAAKSLRGHAHRAGHVAVTFLLIAVAGALPLAGAAGATSRPTTPRAGSVASPSATLGNPGGTAEDFFGKSVAISGETAVVGNDSSSGSGTGVVAIYQQDDASWPVTPNATLSDPGGGRADEFGLSVAISRNTIIVGAPGTNRYRGRAYIYVKHGARWPTKPTATIRPPVAGQGSFGLSVAIWGRTAVVGNPGSADSAFVYQRGRVDWPRRPTAVLKDPTGGVYGDGFANSVAIFETTLIVGNSGAGLYGGAPGSAFIYVKTSTGWPSQPTVTLAHPNAAARDYFGGSVAISGGTAVVGAWGTDDSAGAAYVYVDDGGQWQSAPTTTLLDPPNLGGDAFGWSVALSGGTALVGAFGTDSYAPGAGAAYTYTNGTSGWPTTPTESVNDPANTESDEFGESVAISGTAFVVGAPYSDNDAGVSYIYEE
jgi:FG-GAP repeat